MLHYGLQRSGTNFLEQCLKQNYRISFLNGNKDKWTRSSPLHKHFRLYNDKDIISDNKYQNKLTVNDFEEFEQSIEVVPDFYLIISKDPYSWLLSYKDWAKKCNYPDVHYHYIVEYNLFYGKWLEFSQKTERIVFIRYIDLIEDTNAVLNQVEARMKLKKNLLSRLFLKIPNKVSQSSRFKDDKRTYYMKEKYLKKYSNEDLSTVNSFLDPQVTSLLGYEIRVASK